MKKYSDRLKEFRRRTGMTQTELASRMGLSANYIYQLEAGRRENMGDLAEIKLKAMEDSPVYESENWKAMEVEAAGLKVTLLEPRLASSQSQSQSGYQSETDIVSVMSDFLKDIEAASPAKKKRIADMILGLAQELKGSVDKL